MIVAVTILASENQKSGPIGLAVILVLCVASYFLFKSMSRHLRKVREEFPAEGAPPAPAPAAAADASEQTQPPTSDV